jgi:predicted nucleotidyltransferase
VDFAQPVESLIPGVQGKVLAVLAKTEAELTMRKVAELSGVSSNRASEVLNHLASLGVVERREVGASSVVRLVSENEAVRLVLACSDLHSRVVRRFREEAIRMLPPDICLLAFGSFARRQAREGSDIDVLALADEVEDAHPTAVDSLSRWSDAATRISGNPVNVIQIDEEELPALVQSGSFWRELSEGVLVLAGSPPSIVRVIE